MPDPLQPPAPNAQTPRTQAPHPLVRALCVLMTAVFSGSGLLSVFTEYAPERSTRLGMMGPLLGDAAVSFGITIAIFGLMPLTVFARTPRGAGLFAGACALIALVHLFWSLQH